MKKIIIRLCPDVSPETVACPWKSNTNATSETGMQEESPVRKSSFWQAFMGKSSFFLFHENATHGPVEVTAKQKSKNKKHMGVSENNGTPKWMVYNGKPYQNGWFGGTTIFGNIHMHLKTLSYTKSVSTGWAGNNSQLVPVVDWLECQFSKFLTNSGPVGPVMRCYKYRVSYPRKTPLIFGLWRPRCHFIYNDRLGAQPTLSGKINSQAWLLRLWRGNKTVH